MSSQQAAEDVVRVQARNVGGIDSTEVHLSAGVTVLSGRNATNRTSFLQALMAALGSDRVTLKGDADEGRVELDLDGETYTRTLARRNGTLHLNGTPYLSDPEGADLFAFLVETNEARQAVSRRDDLRDRIMRPVDTDAIQAEISRLEAEKRDLDDQLDHLDALEGDLAPLEGRRTRLEAEIEEKEEALEEKQAELDAADTDLDETRERKAALEDALGELRGVRSRLEDARYRIETERESIDALEADRADTDAELDELPDSPVGDRADIEGEIDRLRDHKASIESTITQLQKIIGFNEDVLEGDRPDLLAAVRPADAEPGGAVAESRGGSSSGSVTDRLVDDPEVVCWTCGSEVESERIRGTLDQLREFRREKTTERTEITEEIAALTDRRDEHERQQRRRERLERKLDEIDAELAEREETIEDHQERVTELEAEIEELETRIDGFEEREYSDVITRHRELNRIEFERGRLDERLHEVADEIDEIEAKLAEREPLEEKRTAIKAEVADLRTRIEQLEGQAVAEFNEHMETILSVLEYENIARIWIERTEKGVREGRRKVTKSVFDLHVVRKTESGATYEDTISHLSESEREVTGLVFALAGYLVHGLHEAMPFMLLDSLEALDADRIAALVDYFEAYAEYLVVALLPEDAAALDDDHHRVTDI